MVRVFNHWFSPRKAVYFFAEETVLVVALLAGASLGPVAAQASANASVVPAVLRAGLASLVFAGRFFPTTDPNAGLLLAYATFSIPFFIRPLGGVIFGHLGDRVGRKAVIWTSILGVLPGADVVIYDGHCSVCSAAMLRLQRADRCGRLAYLSLHDPEVAQRIPYLSHEDLMREIYVADCQVRINSYPVDAAR